MTKKPRLKKYLGFILLILTTALYVILYIFPTLKSINMYKRNAKDYRLKISDLLNREHSFDYPGEMEQQTIKAVNQELTKKITEIKTQEDHLKLFATTFKGIRTTARRDGISNLEITLKPPSFWSTKKADTRSRLEQSRRIKHFLKMPHLNSQVIYISFNGRLEKSLTFINHIPWNRHHLSPQEIIATEGDLSPQFFIRIAVSFVDGRSENEKEQIPSGIEEEIVIDKNSEVLGERIKKSSAKPYPFRELTIKTCHPILTKKPSGGMHASGDSTGYKSIR